MDELRFACQKGCTRCCQGPGHVYLGEGDAERIAGFLGLSRAEFEAGYVYRTGHVTRLHKPRGGSCPFLAGDGCRIHPAKPAQCRAYPFWPELLEDAEAWRGANALCPGLGQGDLIPAAELEASLREVRRAYPAFYRSQGSPGAANSQCGSEPA